MNDKISSLTSRTIDAKKIDVLEPPLTTKISNPDYLYNRRETDLNVGIRS
jgi:hypothetical protein